MKSPFKDWFWMNRHTERTRIEENAPAPPVIRPAFRLCGYFRLLRPRHWVKNALVFVPLFFGLNVVPGEDLRAAFLAAAFARLSSPGSSSVIPAFAVFLFAGAGFASPYWYMIR
jgi:hypothetical protein